MWRSYLAVIIILLVILLFLYLLPNDKNSPTNQDNSLLDIYGLLMDDDNPPLKAKLGALSLSLELANSQDERALGLSGRKNLDKDSGLLFVFPEPLITPFWMRDMHFPIDIIWFDENFRVVDISENLSPETYPKTFSPRRLSQYVLEINAGLGGEGAVQIGDRLELALNPLP